LLCRRRARRLRGRRQPLVGSCNVSALPAPCLPPPYAARHSLLSRQRTRRGERPQLRDAAASIICPACSSVPDLTGAWLLHSENRRLCHPSPQDDSGGKTLPSAPGRGRHRARCRAWVRHRHQPRADTRAAMPFTAEEGVAPMCGLIRGIAGPQRSWKGPRPIGVKPLRTSASRADEPRRNVETHRLRPPGPFGYLIYVRENRVAKGPPPPSAIAPTRPPLPRSMVAHARPGPGTARRLRLAPRRRGRPPGWGGGADGDRSLDRTVRVSQVAPFSYCPFPALWPRALECVKRGNAVGGAVTPPTAFQSASEEPREPGPNSSTRAVFCRSAYAVSCRSSRRMLTDTR
jgi:hypothetical protein